MPDITAANPDIATPELMKAISAAFNSRDVDRIVSHFTDDATFWLARGPEPVGRTLKGKETIRKTLADRFKVIPDMRWDHKEYIYAGNRAISVWAVRGKGADGEDLNYQGCDIYTFRGGQISAQDTYLKIVEGKDRLSGRPKASIGRQHTLSCRRSSRRRLVMIRTLLILAFATSASIAMAQEIDASSAANAAKHDIEREGYRDVRGLAQDTQGVWHGRAL